MPQVLLIGIVGLFAQLIDGALGMSYGVTSTTLLLSVGWPRPSRRRASTLQRSEQRSRPEPPIGSSAMSIGASSRSSPCPASSERSSAPCSSPPSPPRSRRRWSRGSSCASASTCCSASFARRKATRRSRTASRRHSWRRSGSSPVRWVGALLVGGLIAADRRAACTVIGNRFARDAHLLCDSSGALGHCADTLCRARQIL